uniref:Putative secreted protein n=1 Tax=Ixodes ricinus TaxID=34613 RepID=A0A6B0U683_IXORI
MLPVKLWPAMAVLLAVAVSRCEPRLGLPDMPREAASPMLAVAPPAPRIPTPPVVSTLAPSAAVPLDMPRSASSSNSMRTPEAEVVTPQPPERHSDTGTTP